MADVRPVLCAFEADGPHHYNSLAMIGPDGKVEESSVEVVAATVPALGDAAKEVASKLEFQPGKVNDAPVRTRVLLPIVYKAR